MGWNPAAGGRGGVISGEMPAVLVAGNSANAAAAAMTSANVVSNLICIRMSVSNLSMPLPRYLNIEKPHSRNSTSPKSWQGPASVTLHHYTSKTMGLVMDLFSSMNRSCWVKVRISFPFNCRFD
jgi:hypothetical protein